jgi:hypothetical protein
MSEVRVKTILPHNKRCVGCRDNKADIMISFTGTILNDTDDVQPGSGITDLFLTQEQAAEFCIALDKAILINEKIGDENV